MIEHDYDFDPTCGYNKEQLLAVKAPNNKPADFESFWESLYDKTCDMTSQVRLRQIWSPKPDVEAYEVRYTSLDGIAVGAWLTRPKRSKGGIVEGHGYGGIPHPSLYDDFTVIAPCSRGFNLSNSPDIPWEGHAHVLHGIESKESYVIRGSVGDIWRAASILIELFPDTETNLNYTGASFGGGIGALSIPWDKRFKSAYLDVPTFGNHPIRLKYKSIGSSEAVRNHSLTHPEVINVLKYFDAATAAEHISIPTICSPALFDPAVIPPGQFAVNNSIPEKHRQTFIFPAGHFNIKENNPIREEINAAKRKLFSS